MVGDLSSLEFRENVYTIGGIFREVEKPDRGTFQRAAITQLLGIGLSAARGVHRPDYT